MNRQRFINNVHVERSENKMNKYQEMTSEEIYEELKKLPNLIKDQAGKKVSQQTSEIYHKIEDISVMFNVRQNQFAINFEKTNNPEIAIKISGEIQSILKKYEEDLTTKDRDIILKSMILTNLQSDITYQLEYKELVNLDKENEELI